MTSNKQTSLTIKDIPVCRLCGSHPLRDYHNLELVSCGAGAFACSLTEEVDNFPKFTFAQWRTIMESH